jgi:hypothetical protein
MTCRSAERLCRRDKRTAPCRTAPCRSAASTTAASQARSKLAEIGPIVPLEIGEHSGDFANGFAWRARVEPYAPAVPEGVPGGPRLAGFEVEVTVSWSGGREVSLTTLRLAAQQR